MTTIALPPTIITPLQKILAENEDCIRERSDKKVVLSRSLAPAPAAAPKIEKSIELTPEQMEIDAGIDALMAKLDELDARIAAAKKRCEQWDEERKAEAADYKNSVHSGCDSDDYDDEDYSDAVSGDEEDETDGKEAD